MELGRLQSAKAAFDAANIRIVAISTDDPAGLRSAREKASAQFTFLSDQGRELIQRFAIVHSGGGPDGGAIAQSASFLLDDQGQVLWSFATDNYRIRKHPATLLAELKEALKAHE